MTEEKSLTTQLVNLTMSNDQKAELTLVAGLDGKTREERKKFCKDIGCEWEEYQRLKRKYSRVLDRWHEKRRKK